MPAMVRGVTGSFLIALALSAAGCAMVPKVNYRPPASELPAVPQSTSQLKIGVLDARPEVVSGKHNDRFVGVMRSGYGIPYARSTMSGKPLADDFAAVIADAFHNQGSKVSVVILSPFKPREESLHALISSVDSRALLVEIKEYASDTYVHTSLRYDLAATVFGSEGKRLGGAELQGEDELGRGQRPERKDLPSAYRDILQTLLSSIEVKAAFSADPKSMQKPKAACTVEQILKMRDSGLSEEQIKAACGTVH